MEYQECIQRAIDFIEDNISNPITLRDLAEVACFSPFHFHRVFQLLAGEPVMDYVRRRRLAISALFLLDPKRKVLDIALDCGFQSHESFNRAFKRCYGVSPSQYRNGKPLASRLQEKACLKTYILRGGTYMEPKIVVKPGFHLIGYELKTSISEGRNRREIPEFWQNYLQNRLWENIPQPKHPRVELGICTDFNPDDESFVYIIGMEVEEGAEAPEGLIVREFPECEYTVFTTPKASEAEFSSSIHSTWDYAIQTWFPSSGYEHGGGAEIEWYDERSSGSKDKQMDIYIPIKKRG
ncbi:AraC family transcriptional regulator [Peribacillus kribbensis]|uniref:AraC family transcriptional regulator n=1 Tax=Peribacillus kribbensis TaxID=356658 RepID=UPI00042443ED|nr:AraC family transcriptional regulator [Peribacillus kribbensis]